MTHIVLQKVHGVLVPADEASEQFVQMLPNLEGIGFDVRVERNAKMHRRFMALIRLGFDAWEPVVPEDTVGLAKSFDSFREDILILAGHYDSSFGLDGSVRLSAKSIAFSKCDELVFRDLYRRVLTVMWEKVLRWVRYESESEVDHVVSRLLGFE